MTEYSQTYLMIGFLFGVAASQILVAVVYFLKR